MIVRLREDSPKIQCPDAVSIDVGMTPLKEDIMQILFLRTTNYSHGNGPTLNKGLPLTGNNQRENVVLVSEVSSDADQSTISKNGSQGKPHMRWTLIEDIFDLLKSAENKSAADLTIMRVDVMKIRVMLIIRSSILQVCTFSDFNNFLKTFACTISEGIRFLSLTGGIGRKHELLGCWTEV